MPNLRSVIVQVNRNSKSIGSHRNFSTSSHPEVKLAGLKIPLKLSFTKSFMLGAIAFGTQEMFRFYKYQPTMIKRIEERKLVLQRLEEQVLDAARGFRHK